MELVNILRQLWRWRLLVLAAGALAIACGILASYKVTLPSHLESRQYKVGLGSVNVLIDTPDSQVIDLDPKGADAVGTRANLLANLIATSPIKSAIAARVHMPASQLTFVTPSAGGVTTPLADDASVQNKRNESIISIRTATDLPVISVDTQAADAETAGRLANGAVLGLRDYLTSVAATQKVPEARQLVLRQLGAAQVGTAVRGPRRLIGILVILFVFALGCVAIVVVSGVVRDWRAVSAAEKEQGDDDDTGSDRGVSEPTLRATAMPREGPAVARGGLG
jgi:capsular polysaccharide biosynthesis protein